MSLLPLLILALPAQEPVEAAQRTFPLAVEDVVRLVQENGAAVQQARLSALAAEGGLLEAQGAFGTVLFADATYSYAESPASGFFTSFGDTEERLLRLNEGIRHTLTTGGTLTLSANQQNRDSNYLPEAQSDVGLQFEYVQPLLRGGWELSATRDRRRAEYQLDRGRAGIRRANVDVVQQALDTYWDLAFARANVEVLRASLRLAEELRDTTQARFEVGAVAEIEVVQTEADIATRTDSVLGAEEQVRIQQDQLRTLLFGPTADEEWDWLLVPSSDPTSLQTELPEWRDALETARLYRADLRELRVDVHRTRDDWRASRRDLLPQLDFTAQGNLSEQDDIVIEAVADLVDTEFPGYLFSLVFEMPLGSSRWEGTERRTRWEHQLALRTLRDAETALAGEVRAAVRDLQYQERRVDVTRRAREVAQRQLEAEQRRLQEGASTNFQVLQFQTDLAQAATNEAQARIERAKAAARLNTVRGLNWDGSRPDLVGLEAYRPGAELDVD